MRLLLSFATLSIIILINSCKTASEKQSTELSKQDSLQIYFTGLHDSINGYWDEMIKDDDEKLFNIKRLLEEVSYTPSYSQRKFDSLLMAQEDLAKFRYNQETMAQSSLIDEYDKVASELIYEAINFAEENPDFEKYPLMKELIIEIREADSRVLFHRIKYDNYVFQYNAFLKTYPDLAKQFNEGNVPEKYPVFTLEE